MTLQETLKEISSSLTLSIFELVHLAAKAPYTYKIYQIDKKTGGKRTIAQPARETKYVQWQLMEKIFFKLPIHEAATAYREGASIKENASKHKQNQYISKFDFTNFFGSIKEDDLIRHFTKHFPEGASENGIRLISRVSCVSYGPPGLALSIGAPSSPVLSNSVMFEFDSLIHEWCQNRDITYTRYADDLTFSSNIKGLAFEIESVIEETLKTIDYPKLTLNSKKTIHVSKKGQRRITGLIISNDGKISLGRDRKRVISSMIHKYTIGTLPREDIPKLQGLLGFAEDVEPLFSSRMRAKYGINVISEIFQFRTDKHLP